MPHVTIKYFDAPLTDADKTALAETITGALTDRLGCASGAISIALHPVAPADWQEQVYVPDIIQCDAELIKIPDYGRLTAPVTEREEF